MSDIQKILDENIPREVISTRSGGGTKILSYLETWRVIDRMNLVFGSLGWTQEIKELTLLPGTGKPSYRAIVRIQVETPKDEFGMSKYTFKEGVGFGSDKYEGNNAHELAMKEAVSDAFKVAAKNLGRSMGLALYDKTQEYIDENNETKPAPSKKVETPKAKPAGTGVLRQQIKTAFTVLEGKKLISREDFVKDYTKGTKVDDLTDAQVTEVIARIKTDFKQLGL